MDINSKTENKTKQKKPQNKIKLKIIFFKGAAPPPPQKKAKHAVLTKEYNTSP